MSEGPRASCLCRGDKKNTRLAFFVLLAIAALMILLLILQVVTSVVGQAVAFISLGAAAYIFIRYIATVYRYDILSEEDGDYLLIVRVQGKRELTQRKLPLSSLVSLIDVRNDPNVPKSRPDLPVTNYSSHLMADEYTLLHFEGDESALLRVNIDEEFRSVLVSYLPDEEGDEDIEETQDPVNESSEENDDGSC